MKNIIEDILLWVFVWSGTKLFQEIAIYPCAPGTDAVKAIHFAKDKEILLQSMKEYIEDEER